MDFDVIIIGAGVAGLTALRELERAGQKAICLEARDRIGGRILTLREPSCPIPIELGAEFIHGRAPELWNIASAASFGVYDCTERGVQLQNGKIASDQDAWEPVDNIMHEMQKAAASGPDRSFSEFLKTTSHPPEAKALAMSYVQGFNAAYGDVIGIASLAQDADAEEAIDGDLSFRLLNGYDAIPHFLASGVKRESVQTHTVVEAVLWQKDSASVHIKSSLTGQQRRLDARAVVVAVPLGVLQSTPEQEGFIHFDPIPQSIAQAAAQLRMGQVVRTVLQFNHPLWEENGELKDAGFLFSREPVFPTWWTPLPFRVPLITGWSAGPHAESLLGKDPTFVTSRAVEHFARITGLKLEKVQSNLRSAHFHDWHVDPYARGAYSYTPAGALTARTALAKPMDGTLFFAGEATETEGHSGTVHGAIATGFRAAQQVLKSVG